MCNFINIEYLAANALVELYEKKKIRSININTLNNYGTEVEKILNNEVRTAVLLFSEAYIKQFVINYSDLFELEDSVIRIKDNIQINSIRNRILDYAPVDLLQALFDNNAIKILGL